MDSCHLTHHHHQTLPTTDYFHNYTYIVHYRQDINGMKWCWHNCQHNCVVCPIQEYSVEYLQQILKDSMMKYKNSQDYNSYLHIRNMNNIPILVFCLYCNNSWPAASNVILIQNQWCFLRISIRIWLKPPVAKKNTQH